MADGDLPVSDPAPAGGPPPASEPAVAPATEGTLLTQDKPVDGEGEKPEAPAPFDAEKFEYPEGLEMSPEDKTSVGALAQKHGLSSEAMKDLLGEYATRVKAAQESATKAFLETNEKWQAEIKADKEIGGEKLPGVLQTIGKVLDDPTLTDPGFKAALDFTGAGNNPAIVKTFYKMALALTEGKHVGGGPPAQANQKPTGASALYPNLPKG